MPNSSLCKCAHCDYQLLHDSYKFCPQCGRLVNLDESNLSKAPAGNSPRVQQPLSFKDYLKRKSDARQAKSSQLKPKKKSKKSADVLVNIGLMYLCGDTLKPVRGNVV